MTLRRALLAGALASATLVLAAQSWKAAAVASFDDVWKTINDSFYDPTFGGLDWNAVLAELRPRVESASSPDEARAVIREMLARLKKSHLGLLTASAADALPGPATVLIQFRIAPMGVVITKVADSAAAAGLAPGQLIVSIDGAATAEMSRGTEQFERRAAGLEVWRRVTRALHGAEGSSATLRVKEASGALRTVTTRRVIETGETVTLGNLPPLLVEFDAREVSSPARHRVGLISFSLWMTALSDRIAAAVDRFRQHDGIVLDLRGNPGGLAGMMGGIAGHFIGEPVLLGTMHTRQVTLEFRVNPRLVTDDGRRVDVYRGPLAILVDELTGSTSETFVGSVQGLGRARVFGRQTMGQALPAVTKRLALGDVLIYAIGDFSTAGGRSLEGPGVAPDVSILLSPKALAAGHDEVLEAALRWVDEAARKQAGNSRN